ncbi:hypothetical protein ACJRO7_007375 [Eucalyptus globulus]|uniref:Uncharacterized protein n=1 Tax=Eucalyptus globulus TaxID=34317 RepID=A0ABD3ILW6_EUCGL
MATYVENMRTASVVLRWSPRPLPTGSGGGGRCRGPPRLPLRDSARSNGGKKGKDADATASRHAEDLPWPLHRPRPPPRRERGTRKMTPSSSLELSSYAEESPSCSLSVSFFALLGCSFFRFSQRRIKCFRDCTGFHSYRITRKFLIK